VEMGGSLGRREATGRGCMIVTREALGKLGMSLKGARVAVQGFGNVGSIAADLMAKEGAVIVGVSDKSGALYSAKGLDVPDLLKWVREHRQLAGYPQADAGGVTVSYFEWVQDRGGYFWDEDTVNRRLESIMTRSFHEMMAMVEKHKVSTRIACYMLAVERVAAMHRLRGMYA